MRENAFCMAFHVRWISHHSRLPQVRFGDSWWEKSISHGKPYKMHILPSPADSRLRLTPALAESRLLRDDDAAAGLTLLAGSGKLRLLLFFVSGSTSSDLLPPRGLARGGSLSWLGVRLFGWDRSAERPERPLSAGVTFFFLLAVDGCRYIYILKLN